MTSGATGVDSKIWESLTHYHTVNAWLPKNMLVVNRKDFDRLDKATQATVVRLAAEAEKKGWERMRAYNEESIATLAKNRMTIVTPHAAADGRHEEDRRRDGGRLAEAVGR